MCIGFSLPLTLLILKVWKILECGDDAYQGLCNETEWHDRDSPPHERNIEADFFGLEMTQVESSQ